MGLYPGLSAISQAALPKGLKGFSTLTPNVSLGISMVKYLLTPPRSILSRNGIATSKEVWLSISKSKDLLTSPRSIYSRNGIAT